MHKTHLLPAHPERICWGCGKYCPAGDLACGNGSIRTPHPRELFGDDWLDWSEAGSQCGLTSPTAPSASVAPSVAVTPDVAVTSSYVLTVEGSAETVNVRKLR